MKNRKISWLYILFWIFFVMLLIMLGTRIFGHSSTEIQIFLTVLGLFFTGLTDLYMRVGRLENQSYNLDKKVDDLKISMINSFSNVKGDMSKIKEKLGIR